jgi:hypothetical protein
MRKGYNNKMNIIDPVFLTKKKCQLFKKTCTINDDNQVYTREIKCVARLINMNLVKRGK